ncbi:hypothetical protein GCM10009839_05930 [Catenulispora yoronensis]|uniref:Uncharacterized protein n=1 Tax=Catenulispora yoronensis TaxID=450799 RepID=A0ABN2TLW2_9ACTN
MSGTLVLDDATLATIATTLKNAATRMQALGQSLRGLDADAVGADPLIEALHKMQEALGGRLGLLAVSLNELAAKTTEVGTTFHAADHQLATVGGPHRELP